MWKCGQCSEVVESQFDSCWNCGGLQEGGEEVDESRLDASQLGASNANVPGVPNQSNVPSVESQPLGGHDIGYFACRILAVFLGTQAVYFSITGSRSLLAA
jgi:hypothetical protein